MNEIYMKEISRSRDMERGAESVSVVVGFHKFIRVAKFLHLKR